MTELNLSTLKAYGHKSLKCRGEIVDFRTEKLDGGFSPAQVFHITLIFEGCSRTLSLVQKQTFPSEVQVMLALSELTDAPSIPEVIDHVWNPKAESISANWFVTPFYDGTPLTFKDEVPAEVTHSLAQLHYHFQDHVERFESLYRVESSFFENTLASAVKALEQVTRETQNPIFEHGENQLRKTQENSQILQALERLPVTLTHGDMHPGNLIRLPQGRTVLIDWGNASIAPAMLDLANLIEIDSVSWHTYLDAWQEASGESIDLLTAQLGYHWATIMVNTMYMPHAVRFSRPEHVENMVRKVVDAERLICELLEK